jgi:hypothetical protein
LSLSEEEYRKKKNREKLKRYYERHKEEILQKRQEHYLKNRDKKIKYQEKWNLYHDKQLGTTNFGSETSLDYEFKKLGLDKYRDLWHASTKEELEKAKKKLNENKHDSQDKKYEFP